MGKILTIIVPSYNTQDYIDRCIPTMLAHPYTDELELLLVNDGSSDRTLEKLEAYARRYPNTVTVLNKENGGHGSVINTGIKKASGKYLKVVDGDDWVISKKLGKLICHLKQCNADMVIHPYIRWDYNRKKGTTIRYSGNKNEVLPFDKAAPELEGVEIQAITYRTTMLRENGIQVREKCYYEDTEYDIYPIPYVKTVCIYNYPVCVYGVGVPAQSVNPVQAFKNRDMHRMIIKDCIEYYKQNTDYLSLEKKQFISRIILKRIRSHYMIYLKNNGTVRQLEELRRWDLQLAKESVYFYEASHKFPVSFLRLNIIRMYPFVKFMYGCYERVWLSFTGKRQGRRRNGKRKHE